MTIDYDKFTEEEKDRFVLHVLGDPGIRAATTIYLRYMPNASEDKILGFCFRIARKKMQNKLDYIKKSRK